MSINTTSTSEPFATDLDSTELGSDRGLPSQASDVQDYPRSAGVMDGLPDPAVIARLANEFFAALPRSPLPESAAAPPVSGLAPSAPLPSLSELWLPDSQNAMSPGLPPNSEPSSPSFPATRSAAGISAPTGAFPFSPLTEADLRAIPASLAGATALVPGAPGTVPPSPTPMAPTYFPDGIKAPTPGADPTFLSPGEMFSFPSVLAMPSSPPTAPPSGVDVGAIPASSAGATALPGSSPYFLDGEKGANPATPPAFPPVDAMFSMPRVPAMPDVLGFQSTPSIPMSPAAPTSISPAPASLSGLTAGANAAPVASPIMATPAPPNSALPSPQIPHSSEPAAEAASAVYPGATTSFPSPSAMFSFPGVPGAQSAPGLPAMPASPPPVPTKESDVRASMPNVTMPGMSGYVPAAPPESSAKDGLPSGVESPAFHREEIPQVGYAKRPLDARLIRRDFPILQEQVHGRPLIWLDNAATTQKPNAVIDRISAFYRHENSNIHRAAHTLAARATDAYESAREKTRRFLKASSTREIIFVRGTTEGINFIAKSWGNRYVNKGDEVIITWLEHHANIVPWQQLCAEKGARLRVAPVNDRGEVILEEYEKLFNPRTRIVSFSQVSNALGTITPAREMVAIAHHYGAKVVVDGAQSVSHMPIDVQSLDCDFFVFSGHKVFGPTGIGAVYGKLDVLDETPPWQGGGNMIADVTFEKTTYQPPPARFEAGTGNIADAVGLGAALDYVEQVGMENIAAYEHELLQYGTAGLLTVPGLRLIGTAREKAGVMSFVLDDMRTEDVGAALNQEGIAVRSGHHCAQPILRRMGVEATVRPSLALYNTYEDIDALVSALLRIQAGRAHRKT